MLLGHLAQIWRYPVKSMGGEVIESALLTREGIPGDRCWAVIDGELDEIRSAKRWPELLNYRARLERDCSPAPGVFGEALPPVYISCPDDDTINSGEAEANEQLSELLGRPARLAPLEPPSNRQHYRLANERSEESMTREMGLMDGEAMPDFAASMSAVLESLAEHVTPPGTYFDAFPLHLMSNNTLRFLSGRAGMGAEVERYRPNLVIEPLQAEPVMTENDWVGKRLQIGDAVIRISSRTVRCSMPAREQRWAKLPQEPGLTRAMVEHCERHLGVNVLVEESATVNAGDEVHLLED